MSKVQDGLQDEWSGTMEPLWALIRSYSIMNRIMSFGQDIRLRRESINFAVDGGRVLDAGCGPGTMTKLIFESNNSRELEVCLIDPSRSMLWQARKEVDRTKEGVSLESAVMENLPFRSAMFDAVVCGFSLRDAMSIEKALTELFRVLKENGRLLVVDLGKPDNRIMRTILGVYWRFCVPFIATLVAGKTGRLYSALYKTYRLYPDTSELQNLVKKQSRKMIVKEKLFGGALVIIAAK